MVLIFEYTAFSNVWKEWKLQEVFGGSTACWRIARFTLRKENNPPVPPAAAAARRLLSIISRSARERNGLWNDGLVLGESLK